MFFPVHQAVLLELSQSSRPLLLSCKVLQVWTLNFTNANLVKRVKNATANLQRQVFRCLNLGHLGRVALGRS